MITFCDIHICIQSCTCFQEESPEKQFDAHDCSETEPAHRGESRRERPPKWFYAHDFMKIETPNRRLEVVKTGQTRGSSQGDPRRERPPKGFYAHDFMKIETPKNCSECQKDWNTCKLQTGARDVTSPNRMLLQVKIHFVKHSHTRIKPRLARSQGLLKFSL